MEVILDSIQIQEIIPHRYPFLLIDSIVELEPGKGATAIKNVTANENQFMGHFPGNPVMPGVLMLEGLAQTGAVAMMSLEENKGKTPFFGGVKNCRFKRVVRPGDQLVYKVEITKNRGPMGIGIGIATVNGEVAVKAELTFALA